MADKATSVCPGDQFGDLTVLEHGEKMQRAHCHCDGCQSKCRIIVYCLLNGRKRRCDPCDRSRDTGWKSPVKWKNTNLDPRNDEILKARKEKKSRSNESRYGKKRQTDPDE